jgi:hypothetical protein
MANYIYNEDIQRMTYNQLAKALVSGELTEKRLRSYYTDARRKATDRNRRVQSSEFGKIAEPQRFMTLKNLPTQSALLHEIADVNRFLSSKRSTISGQRALKEKHAELTDTIWRSYGLLRYARQMDEKEFMQHWSNLRLGTVLEVLKTPLASVDELLTVAQSAHAKRYAESMGAELTVDQARCAMIRTTLRMTP